MVCSAAGTLGDSYCSLAWGKTLAAAAGPATAASVLRSKQAPDLSEREQALGRWAQQVVQDPNATALQDVDALRAAGLSDQEIFEATVFVAFRMAFSTVNDALGVEPDAQVAQAAPQEVRDAVTFGRAVATA
jgi:alkylhydroperoxidase family enzyme